MQKARLTRRYVESLPVRDDRYIAWDAALSGFGVRVSPSGVRTYVLQYRPKGSGRGSAPKFVTIGRHGYQVTVEQARETAQRLRGMVALGEDPARDLSWRREGVTMKELGQLYLADMAARGKKPKGIEDAEQIIRLYIEPKMGTLKVAEVDYADVMRLVRTAPAIAISHATRKDRVRAGVDGQRTAGRVLRTLKAMFNRAMRQDDPWRGMRRPGTNPCAGEKPNEGRVRERLPSTREITVLFTAIGDLLRSERISPWGGLLFVLLAFTGGRLREIMHARRAWCDLGEGVLRLPDSKTGKKVIQLSPLAQRVIAAIPEMAGNPYLICGAVHGRPMVNPYKVWKAICTEAGVTDLTPHDWRRAFASTGYNSGIGITAIAALLGHKDPRTTERWYARMEQSTKGAVAAQISSRLEEHLGAELLAFLPSLPPSSSDEAGPA